MANSLRHLIHPAAEPSSSGAGPSLGIVGSSAAGRTDDFLEGGLPTFLRFTGGASASGSEKTAIQVVSVAAAAEAVVILLVTCFGSSSASDSFASVSTCALVSASSTVPKRRGFVEGISAGVSSIYAPLYFRGQLSA